MKLMSYILVYLLGVLLGCLICLIIKVNKTKNRIKGGSIKLDTENELYEITIPKEVIKGDFTEILLKVEK